MKSKKPLMDTYDLGYFQGKKDTLKEVFDKSLVLRKDKFEVWLEAKIKELEK
jgi:hypothetical protein